MARTLKLEIVTPEKRVVESDVESLVLPALEGELGVLPGHAPLLAALACGELRIHRPGEPVEHFAVSGGFAEVHPHKVEVFAETAELSGEIDRERARLAAEKAKKEIEQAATPKDLAGAQAALRRALLRLRVAEGISRSRTAPR